MEGENQNNQIDSNQYYQDYGQEQPYFEETLESKQAYLQQQIVDQNYDQEEFGLFLQNKKGVDIQNYSLQELYDYVYEFQTLQWEKYQGTDSQNYGHQSEQIETDVRNTEFEMKKPIPSEKPRPSVYQAPLKEVRKEAQVNKVQPTVLDEMVQKASD